jgi:hypothetical protein
MRRVLAALICLPLLLAACTAAPGTISQHLVVATSGTATSSLPVASDRPTAAPLVTVPPGRPLTPAQPFAASPAASARSTTGQSATAAARTPPAAAFYYRLEVRRIWTDASAGRDTVYLIDVMVCNQTQSPQAIRADALSVIVRPRGRPGAVGYSIKPQPTPDGGFTGTPTAQPGACAGGVVSLVPPQSEIPASLWYRRGAGPDAAEPVELPFPE